MPKEDANACKRIEVGQTDVSRRSGGAVRPKQGQRVEAPTHLPSLIRSMIFGSAALLIDKPYNVKRHVTGWRVRRFLLTGTADETQEATAQLRPEWRHHVPTTMEEQRRALAARGQLKQLLEREKLVCAPKHTPLGH